MALHARIEKEAPKAAPIQVSEENMLAGAHVYRTNCAVCHGLPNQPAEATSKGMFPRPPQLFKTRRKRMILQERPTGKCQTGSG